MSYLDGLMRYTIDIAEGVYDTGADIALGFQRVGQAFGLSGRERFDQIGDENSAALRLLTNLVKRSFDIYNNREENPIYQSITIILTRFYMQLPDEVINDMANKGTIKAVGGAGKMIVVGIIVQKIAQRIFAIIAASTGYMALASKLGFSANGKVKPSLVTTGVFLLTVNAVLQRSSNASLRLLAKSPRLYYLLRFDDLHMIYFLLEEPMKYYVEACTIAEKNPAFFHEEVIRIYTTINKVNRKILGNE